MKLTDEEQALRAGAVRPGGAVGDRASDQGRRLSRRRRLRAGDAGAHHGRHRVAGRGRRRMAGTHGRPAGRAAAGAHSDHHRSARHRLRGRASAQAAALDARPRAPRHRRVRGARRADDRTPASTTRPSCRRCAASTCAYGDTGVVIYSNSVCGARSNFEGGPSALSAGLTGRTPRYGYHLDERRRGHAGRQCRLDAARARRLGRARRDRRPAGRRLLAGARPRRHRPRPRLRRDEAFRRRAGELRLGRAVPHGRHHAGGAAARRCRDRRRDAAHP